jgi:zinc transporter ZupT
MRMLDAAITPGTTANVAVSLGVTMLVIPRIPNRVLAAAAGFAAGSILGGNLATLRPPALSPRR